MKGLQNSFMTAKATTMSPHTCEGAANLALQVIKSQYQSKPCKAQRHGTCPVCVVSVQQQGVYAIAS